MPFLWNATMKLLTKSKSPSPKHGKRCVLGYYIKKASPPAFLRRKLTAGMTVEAAIVLPLFLFFFVNLGSAIEMIRLHGNLQLALWDVGNRMCLYGYAANLPAGTGDGAWGGTEEDGNALLREMGDVALTYTYVKSQVVNYAGENYLQTSPLSYGVSGLQFWESDVFGENRMAGEEEILGDVVDVVMTYQVSPWLNIPFLRPFRMTNRYYGKLWTGYELHVDSADADEERDKVYVAENGSVYHERADCTHLKLSIREASLAEAKAARNESGDRYEECSKCGKKPFQGTVFIAREGEYYHYDRDCSGLKRTIYTITRRQASKYKPCSRCLAAP